MSERLRTLLSQPRTAIMGVVNTTPDSFSDGGRFLAVDAAVEHALRLVEEGADIIDIGGESTRPGADPVTLDEELARVIPVIEGVKNRSSIPISIDTSKPQVMREALAAGAAMVNDVNGLRAEAAVETVAANGCMVCIMHMQGAPQTMQADPSYHDVVTEVETFLRQRIDACVVAGIDSSRIVVDPGIGFGKTLQHNLQLLAATTRIKQSLGCEVLIGVSRKSMIDGILGRKLDERLFGSVGLAVQAALNSAKIVRVHDVAATHDAVRCAEAVVNVQNDKA